MWLPGRKQLGQGWCWAVLWAALLILGAAPAGVAQTVAPPEATASRGVDREAQDAYLSGGKHALGAWVGLSLHSGHYLGFDKDVKWLPVNVQYSYRFWTHDNFALRYAPEANVLAMIDEPASNFGGPSTERRRSFGGGLTPAGFEMNFYPKRRVQPFLSEHSGMYYFSQRVLSPQGSQLLFLTDLGLGLNIFRTQRQAFTIGYRYQHISNANISDHNPGTDANTFYVGASRFWTKGVR